MPPQRRTYSKSFKAQVIQECSEPGASIEKIIVSNAPKIAEILVFITEHKVHHPLTSEP